MTTTHAKLMPIEIIAGVQPNTDATPFVTSHYTMSDKIRFRFGRPRKIGGWVATDFDYGASISGKIRSIYSAFIGSVTSTVVGTHQKLYSIKGTRLTNITPLSTTTNAIPDSLNTDYYTLAADPISTVDGSNVITIADADAARYQIGDHITISGATSVGGIDAATYINIAHSIHTIGTGNYTFLVGATATSTATGGGAAVLKATGLLEVSATAHGQANGDRVKLAGAVDTGGILAADINAEFIIRNVSADIFEVMTDGVATSLVGGGGGAAVTYQKEIADGYVDEAYGMGYGMGLYGVGLYGTALLSSSGRKYPRIWFMDRYGDNFVMTAGNETGIYSWDGDTVVAPTLISGAPTDVNYAFVSDNILLTFGSGGIKNRIFASDQGDFTNWTSSSTNQVFDDNIEGADKLISHVSVAGRNLLFTEHQTYSLSYIGLPLVWKTELIDGAIGIIAPMARCVVNGVAYWMGQSNFYKWAGGNIEIIPANTQVQSTILNYVFSNLTSAQRSKIFCWYNEQYNEIWWHYPASASNEPDRVARLQVGDLVWSPDTMDRTAAEYPILSLGYPRLAGNDSLIYRHEYGSDANGAALAWTLTSNSRYSGKANALLSGFVPDSIQTGNISVDLDTRQFPQSAAATFGNSYTITPTTERVTAQNMGRFWKYTWRGDAVGNDWQMGQWLEYIQESSQQ